MRDQTEQHFEVAIIGAGFSGLGMAMALKQDGIDDFVVLEPAADLGGTWRDNSYPGCACDIPSVLYSWSDEQNPEWSRLFAPQPEILEYMKAVVDRHDIDSHLRFDTDVQSADWEDDHWRIETSQGTTLTAFSAADSPTRVWRSSTGTLARMGRRVRSRTRSRYAHVPRPT